MTAATSSGSRASRKPSARAPKNATASQSTGRESAEATCHTSVLMNRKVMNSSSIGRARVTSRNSDPSSAKVRTTAQRAIGPASRTSAAATTARTVHVGEQDAEHQVRVLAQHRDDRGRAEREDRHLDDADPAGPFQRALAAGQVGHRPHGDECEQHRRRPAAGARATAGRLGTASSERAEVGQREDDDRTAVGEVVHRDPATLDEERQAVPEEPLLGLPGRALVLVTGHAVTARR